MSKDLWLCYKTDTNNFSVISMVFFILALFEVYSCYEQNVSPQNSYFEIPTHNVVAFEGGAFGMLSGLNEGMRAKPPLHDGISALIKEEERPEHSFFATGGHGEMAAFCNPEKAHF